MHHHRDPEKNLHLEAGYIDADCDYAMNYNGDGVRIVRKLVPTPSELKALCRSDALDASEGY